MGGFLVLGSPRLWRVSSRLRAFFFFFFDFSGFRGADFFFVSEELPSLGKSCSYLRLWQQRVFTDTVVALGGSWGVLGFLGGEMAVGYPTSAPGTSCGILAPVGRPFRPPKINQFGFS